MKSYQSLHVWQRAHNLVVTTLRETDLARQPKTWAVFDQLRRAAVSVEANVVEGYALRAPRQFRRHLRDEAVKEILALSDSTIALLLGLLRRPMPMEK